MPSSRSRTTALGATLATVVGLALLSPLSAPASGQDTGPRTADLLREAHSPVSSAAVRLDAGDEVTEVAGSSSFEMVGVTWEGAGDPSVEVQVRQDGAWSGWTELEPLTHGAADEGTTSGTEPVWYDGADAVRTRVSGSVRDLQLVLIQPGRDPRSTRTASDGTAGASFPSYARTRSNPLRPAIRSRKQWGANESWRNGGPYYNRRLKQVHVHHTVNGNRYSRGDVPGILRGIYRYHTKSLGWSDVGYNFLVDRFGRIWEGRAGGVARKVRGAHTLGFNHQSTGVSVIGNYQGHRLGKRARRAVVRVAAWKLDKAGVGPRSRVWSRSEGSDKYREGRRVRLPAIDGHRDTNDTSCPGGGIYKKLPNIRRQAARRINRLGD